MISPAERQSTGEHSMNAEEERNVAAVRRWQELYNGRTAACWTECCSPDVRWELYSNGGVEPHVQFSRPELISLVEPRNALNREALVTPLRFVASGDTVVAEEDFRMVLSDGSRHDWRIVRIVTLKDGLITSCTEYGVVLGDVASLQKTIATLAELFAAKA
jgi:ketosteroid isomerase-like protein